MPLKLTRRHGSPYWYIRGTVRGITVDESTGLQDKEKAEELRAKREWEIIEHSVTGRRTDATFLAAAVSYLDCGGEARFVHRLIDHFGTRPLAEIGQAEVEAAARKLFPNAKSSTIVRQVFTPISAIMRHAAVRGMCDRKVYERPAQPRGRVRWITVEEAERLIAASSPHLRPLIIFLLYTGGRVGEALALHWRDVDLARAHATFLDTKNGECRGVPLHRRVVEALSALKHREGAVFLTDKRRAYAPKSEGGGQIKKAFRNACVRAKIENFHPHDCRHTWATWHYMANRDLTALMALGGWKTITMVTRYAHVNVANLASSVNKLPGEKPEKKQRSRRTTN